MRINVKQMSVDNTNMPHIYSLPTLATVSLHPLGAHVGVYDLSILTSSPPECPIVSSACPQGSSPCLVLPPAGRCGLPLITSDSEVRRMKEGEEVTMSNILQF